MPEEEKNIDYTERLEGPLLLSYLIELMKKVKLPGSIIDLEIEDSLLEEIDKVRGEKSREEWILEAVNTYSDMLGV